MKKIVNDCSKLACPLCTKIESFFYHEDKNRTYVQCQNCFLVYVPKSYYLTSIEEKKQYDLHKNSPNDINYRKFLSRLFEPMNQRLSEKSSGLDFGSGPGPTLSIMFQEMGHFMNIYDKFYACDKSVLKKNYDFVCMTEVIEHLDRPKQIISDLLFIIKKKGLLGIMTKRVIDKEHFTSWHYKNDLTHICFYSVKTFQWIAKHYDLELTIVEDDVVIYRVTCS